VRVRDKALIPASFVDLKRIDKAMTLLVAAGAQRAFDSTYWKKAKAQLKAESGGKCAYCEAPTSTVAHGDVEHFRPKSVYWWLAYCYDNYLYACQICNETYKGDNFPLSDPSRRMKEPALAPPSGAARRKFAAGFAPDPLDAKAVAKFEKSCRGEGCLLLNPYIDDPDRHLTWEADEAEKEVWVRPKGKASKPYHEAAETYYGLNRPNLRIERWRVYRYLETIKEAYLEPRIQGTSLQAKVTDQLREMIEPTAPFAGMCRFFVKRKWRLPV
jgi:hypothetical protein